MESKESHNPVKTQAFRLMERCRGGCSRYRGHTGQDEVYLAELLLRKGHEVRGIKRRAFRPTALCQLQEQSLPRELSRRTSKNIIIGNTDTKGEKSC